ncbi:MAG: acyl-CoA thioesterase [Acidobacteriia bacterium]|nr:acyl-CoA thioesterase [Methyloceanibacter sp.]MBX5471714.1 acyl-CoA thioesterase [Acetobacteraceae bacterium]MCL6490995.1 acyl-CoA thioesterase [Terriglobia bacterium]
MGPKDTRNRERRDAYRFFHTITTRWKDNDVYGHVNNVVYYSYFDTAVNYYLVSRKVLDIARAEVVGIVAETGCRFYASISFPDRVDVGIRAARIGRSSVRYEIGVFRNDEDIASAEGYFVHVYVDRVGMRPVPIPEPVRRVLQEIAVEN